jgi:hypothetical protein
MVVFAVLPVISFAETATSNTNKEKNNIIKTEIDAQKESIKNSAEERRLGALDKIKGVVDQFIQNVFERFTAADNRLIKLADRIDSRIGKLQAAKINVSTSTDLMIIARARIDDATTSVATILSKTGDISPKTTMATIKEEFKTIKAQIETAKEKIKIAHAALVDVVNSLKPGQNKLDKENKGTN